MNEKQFEEERRSGIGGSDIPVILGVSPFGRTVMDVAREKLGLALPIVATAPMRRGRILEPIAAKEYTLDTERKLATGEVFIRHPEKKYMIAHVDAKILRDGVWDGILEIKIPNIQTYLRYKREGLGDYIQLQLQHYLGVTGQAWGSMYIWNPEIFSGFHVDVKRDDALIDLIFNKAGEFWDYIQRGQLPPETGQPITDNLPSINAGELTSMEGVPAWVSCANDLRLAAELRDEAEAIYERAKEKIIELMGPLDAVEGAGVRVYHRETPGRKTLDKAAVFADMYKLRNLLQELLAILTAAGRRLAMAEHKAFSLQDDFVKRANLILEKVCAESTYMKQGKPGRAFRPYFLNRSQIE
jgi:putative phage-type endonuclease